MVVGKETLTEIVEVVWIMSQELLLCSGRKGIYMCPWSSSLESSCLNTFEFSDFLGGLILKDYIKEFLPCSRPWQACWGPWVCSERVLRPVWLCRLLTTHSWQFQQQSQILPVPSKGYSARKGYSLSRPQEGALARASEVLARILWRLYIPNDCLPSQPFSWTAYQYFLKSNHLHSLMRWLSLSVFFN